jgi:hypothetical protein
MEERTIKLMEYPAALLIYSSISVAVCIIGLFIYEYKQFKKRDKQRRDYIEKLMKDREDEKE